ncbi:MAG TPA: purine-nucleoside phosphorylase [Gemmatimonadales bacterium]|nr:purine-nucleoside phosphorylase [Gemmatimonadales bacterium]
MMTVAGGGGDLRAAVEAVRARIGDAQPRIGIVLGSGLGGLTERVASATRIDYDRIPGFHAPRVPGHAGQLVAGTLAGTAVILQSGRFHMYEGHDAAAAALPVRVFAELGVETLIVTNAAGGVNPAFGPGTLMLIRDHLNLTGRTPLEGPALEGEVRFPDMSVAYDADLRARAHAMAASLDVRLEEGVYAGLLGPSYETPAEIRMLRTMGADAVGMSTVVEVIAARARGIRCLGISLITNAAAGVTEALLDHADVMVIAKEAGGRLAAVVEAMM